MSNPPDLGALAAQAQQLQAQAQAQMATPQPVPMRWNVVPAQIQGQQAVVIEIHSPTGVFVGFLSPADAIEIGGKMRQAAKQAKSGLLLPPGAGA